ncbi:MAG: Two-component system, OmpR family, sensor kinase [Pseudonocardiales bacterium]|nr:Two-component system, OmpR family, sensor kinase [Pseudonocardiales bacterium]
MTSDPSVHPHRVAPTTPPPPVPPVPPAAPWPNGPQPVDPNAWTAPPPGWEELPSPAAEKPPRRWRFGPRSLTGRLVTGVVSLVVVLVLATGIGTYYALRSFLFNRLDQQVAQVADSNAAFIQRCLTGDRCVIAPSSNGLQGPLVEWLTALNAKGVAVASPAPGLPDLRNLALSPSQAASIIAHPVTSRTLTAADGTKLRVATRTLVLNNQQFYVVSGLSEAEVGRTLSRLLRLEFLIGAAAILLAFVATASGVRFSLRRLYGVTRTAREVAAELSPDGAGLDRRVPVHEPGTEVGQLAESMNTLLSAVETQFAARLANEQRMRQFLADASHELRTPLTSIRGYAELARIQRRQGRPEADNLERIESEGTRMSRLVDDLLTLARSDQGGSPEREWVDLTELVEDAVTGARAAFPARQIDASAPHGLHVIGDRDQLLRVVRNLVTNAAVHTRPDGPIEVSALSEGDAVVVRITDAGPGLPPEEAAHVFERFWRADKARSRVRGGSGLGLAIVASIVQAHGGAVWFDSTVDGGSTVTVRLPIGMA